MCNRCCANCLYACGVRKGPAGMLVCASCPEAPGDLTRVQAKGCCPRFRAKPKPVVRLKPPQPPDEKTKFIPLTRGKFAMVDAADFEWLSQYKWHAIKVAGKYYACCRINGRTTLMHRLIMDPPPGMVVDHRDGQSLDNHRCNLRVCTQQQNVWNSRPCGARSGFKGVTPHRNKWSAKLKYKGRVYRLGDYDDPVEAARARDRMAVKLLGEYAWLNLPDESPGGAIDVKNTVRGRSGATTRRPVRRRGSAGRESQGRKKRKTTHPGRDDLVAQPPPAVS